MNIKDDFNFKIVNEKFPHIGLGIDLRWGSKDLPIYIEELLRDTKGHTRQGFPFQTYTALVSLLDLHDKDYPQFVRKYDAWTTNFLN